MENIGHLRTAQYYFKHVNTALISQIKKYFLKQGREFVTTVDASPYIFSAKATRICIIDEEKCSVLELLSGCNIYEESLDGEGTAASLLAYMKIFGLERSGCQCLIMDGCVVNTAAVNPLVTLCNNINVNRVR